MLLNSKDAGKIKGLVFDLVQGGLNHLQNADDTVIFRELDDQNINTKFLWLCFENMFGQKINLRAKFFVLGCQKKREWWSFSIPKWENLI
jgi:hypothetical protein